MHTLASIVPNAAVIAGASLLLLYLIPGASIAARITTGIDEQAKLPYWELQDEGISIRLVQRLPDQTRGFFLARGFNAEDVELVAQGCVFQTVFKNTSNESKPGPISYDQRDWIITHDGQKTGMKTREDWHAIWKKRNVSKSAQIAFKWGLYPTRQTYNAGDYNWGMSTIDLKPGTRFDLEIVWQQYDHKQTAIIKDMQCAPDLDLEPAGE